MDREREIGQILRQKRLEFGWSVETVAQLYGNAVNGHPITGGAVFNMEEGTTIPKGEQRRWVLARIFQLPPAALGLQVLQGNKGKIPSSFSSRRSQVVDVSEYEATLNSYRMQGYKGSPESALMDLGQRIYALQDNAYYTRSPEREQMKRLLCRYLGYRSTIASELSYYSSALDGLNKVIILAQEENFLDLEAYSRYKRAEFYFVKRNFPRALRELKEAQSKMGSAPREVRGTILHVRGLTEAYLVQTDSQLCKAIQWIDSSEHYITPQSDQKNDTLLSCTETSVRLDRAKALLAPRDRKMHLSEEAYQISDEILQQSDPVQKRRHAYHTLDHYITLAQYYLDKDYYSIATTQTENALSQMVKMHSLVHLPTIVNLYEQLTETSYRNSVALAELGLHLLFVQYPSLWK